MTKPKICMVSFHSCIRVVKEMQALIDAGYIVELITSYGNFGYDITTRSGGLSMFATEQDLRKYLRESKADIFHVHNYPNEMLKIVLEEKPGQTVCDIHDLASLETGEINNEEKFIFENASAIIHVSNPIKEFVENMYHPKCKQYVLYSYCNKSMIPETVNLNPLEDSIIYEGGIYVGDGMGPGRHRDILPLAKEFLKEGFSFHVYPAGEINVDIAKYMKKYSDSGVTVHETIQYDVLMSEMQNYEWGAVISPIKNKLIEYAMPNKLFEYLVQGIPIVIYNYDEASKFVEEHGVGIVLHSLDEIGKLKDKDLYNKCKQNIIAKRFEWTMEKQVNLLREIYSKILEEKKCQ